MLVTRVIFLSTVIAVFSMSLSASADPAEHADPAATEGAESGAVPLEGDAAVVVNESSPYDAKHWVLQGLKHNFSVRIGRLEVDNSEDRVVVSLGDFAPRATTSLRYRDSERAQNQREFFATNDIRIFEEEVASLEVRLEDRFAYGTRMALSSSTSRLDNSTNQQPTSLYHPEFQTTTQLQVVQPLLKNRGREVNMAGTDLARSEVLGAEFELRSELEKVIAEILIAYAETEFGFENLKVKEDAVRLADDLVAENRRRVEEGLMSPIDVTQAEARRAEAQEEVVGARTFLAERRNRLLELTGSDYTFGQEVPIGGSASGVLAEPTEERLSLAKEMLESNPIYQAALTRAEAEGIRVAYAKNQLLPQLDLEATFGYNGLNDSFTSSYEDFSNRNQPDWSIGLVFSMPLDRSADRAQVSLAKRGQRQAVMTAKQTEVQLLVLLDNSVREVDSARERIGLARESVRLAEEALRSEEKRLASGLTTSYNVLNQQRDLSFARTRALAAEIELFRAVTQLYVVTGSLSEQLNFDVTLAGL